MSESKSLNEQLWEAACEGNEANVVNLLDRGAEMDAKGWNGITPLIGAAAAGHVEVVRVLLHRGANPSLTDDRGFTAVEAASMNDYAQIAKIIRLAGGAGDTKNLLQRALEPVMESGVPVELVVHSSELGKKRKPWWKFW